MLSDVALDHFRNMIPFDAVQKTMEKAGDLEPETEDIDLAEPLPDKYTDEHWNFMTHGSIDGPVKTAEEVEAEKARARLMERLADAELDQELDWVAPFHMDLTCTVFPR